MTEELTQVAAFTDETSADLLAGLLRGEGLPVEVRPVSPLPGIVDEVEIYVPTAFADRARALIESSNLADAET